MIKITRFFILIIVFASYFTQQWIPKIIWTYWHDPLPQSNNLIRAFHHNHLKYTQGWELRHLDRENMWKWLDQIPRLRQRLQSEAWRSQGLAKKSDIIRMSLINYYGGVYFDKTTILTSHIDWILDIKNRSDFFSDSTQDEPDVFVQYAGHSNGEKIFSSRTQAYVPIIPNLEIFFIAGKPNTKFFTDWLNKAFQQKQISYRKYGNSNAKSYLYDVAIQDQTPISFDHFGNYFEVIICGGNMMHKKQKQLQKIDNNNSNSLQLQLQFETGYKQIKPLALKYYKLCLMNAYVSAYTYEKNYDSIFTTIYHYLCKKDINQLIKQNNYAPYFIKLWNEPYKYLNYHLERKKHFCHINQQILNTSIMNVFLLKDYDHGFENIYIVEEINRYYEKCPMLVVIVGACAVIVGFFRRRGWRCGTKGAGYLAINKQSVQGS